MAKKLYTTTLEIVKDTKFLRAGDKPSLTLSDHADGERCRSAAFGALEFPGEPERQLWAIGCSDGSRLGLALLLRSGKDRTTFPTDYLIIYARHYMAANDWDAIKNAVLSGSPVFWEIIRKRSRGTKSAEIVK